MARTGPVARTLADDEGRFQTRQKSFTADGEVEPIAGYTEFAPGQILIRHDVLRNDGSANVFVAKVFAHELLHAMCWQNGALPDASAPLVEANERLAQRFAASLGFE